MSVAIAAATVDLPSLGKHDVKPMTLLLFVVSVFRSTVSFIDRMASAYGDDGESMIVRIIFGAEQMLLSAIPRASDIAAPCTLYSNGWPTREHSLPTIS